MHPISRQETSTQMYPHSVLQSLLRDIRVRMTLFLHSAFLMGFLKHQTYRCVETYIASSVLLQLNPLLLSSSFALSLLPKPCFRDILCLENYLPGSFTLYIGNLVNSFFLFSTKFNISIQVK